MFMLYTKKFHVTLSAAMAVGGIESGVAQQEGAANALEEVFVSARFRDESLNDVGAYVQIGK